MAAEERQATATLFFGADRARFFRPLDGARRERVAACLRSLYERLHGPSADYANNFNRDELKELLMPAVQAHQDRLDVVEAQDELSTAAADDPPSAGFSVDSHTGA